MNQEESSQVENKTRSYEFSTEVDHGTSLQTYKH